MHLTRILLHMSAFSQQRQLKRVKRLADLCGRVRFPAEWNSGPNWWQTLNDFDLWFVWSGRGTMQLEGEQIDVAPGTCFWMRPGRRYHISHDPTHRLAVNFFHFDVLNVQSERPESTFVPPFEHTRVQHAGFADVMMQRILQLRTEPDGRESADRLFGALLEELVREAEQRAPSIEGLRKDQIEHFQRVMADIRSDPASSPSVEELARKHGYSVSHFSRLFGVVAGKRPQQFIIEARLDHAKTLLALTEEGIGTIALNAGFEGAYYFSRLFKRRLGVTPSEYRRNLSRS